MTRYFPEDYKLYPSWLNMALIANDLSKITNKVSTNMN